MKAHINGVDIFFDVVGSGLRPTPQGMVEKPVVFVHHGGPGCDHTLFRPYLDDLAETAQLVFVDHRGTGRSGRAENATYTIEQMADDLEALRHHLGVEKPMLIGHSFGGMVAQVYAQRYPNSLSKLILMNTAPSAGFWEEAKKMAEEMATDDQKEVLDQLFEGSLESQQEFEDWWATCMPLYFHNPDPEVIEAGKNSMRGDVVVANYMMEHEIPKFDARAGLPDIQIPTLIVAGKYDWVTPLNQADEIRGSIQHAEYVLFEDSGHMPYIEQHSEFVEALTRFVNA